MKLRPLIKDQRIHIDNHNPGKPITWDWPVGERPDDVHLDKSMNKKVHGKYVKVRVTLNNNQGANIPKKCEREDRAWMDAYNKMMEEVHEILSNNEDIKNQLVEDVKQSIIEIGPQKRRRAIRKALKRIADHFGLPDEKLFSFKMVTRGTFALYYDDEISTYFYVGIGNDYAFYLGEGNGRDFSRRVKGKKYTFRRA